MLRFGKVSASCVFFIANLADLPIFCTLFPVGSPMGVNGAFIPALFVVERILSITSRCWSWRSSWLSSGMVGLASSLRRVVVVLMWF